VNHAATIPEVLQRIQRPALFMGAAGMVLCALGWVFVAPERFLLSYLLAYLFWVGIPLGCLGILMLQHLTGGQWGFIIRRPLESSTRMFPLMVVLFLPILFGFRYLYSWAGVHPTLELSSLQEHYLSPGLFVLRAIIYFIVWLILAFLLNHWSSNEDHSTSQTKSLGKRFEFLSAPGLVLYFLTVTFAVVDWVMSLDPRWFSTIFGMLFLSGQAVGALAFMIVLVWLFSQTKPLREVITADHFQDLGNLLLAFVMIWAYISFSQYLLIWSANLREENPFYIYRTRGGWQWIALLLIVFHFFIPFVLLLGRTTKRHIDSLGYIAATIVIMRFVDLFWNVIPMYSQGRHQVPRLSIHWLDIAAALGIGGIWIAVFIQQLKRRPLIPPHDLRLQEVGHHG
jgi:hypothetical protein